MAIEDWSGGTSTVPDKAQLVEVDVEEVLIDKEEGSAILIKTNDGDEVWIPRKLIQFKQYNKHSELVQCSLPEWFAIREGLV